jgi:peptide/nickel transport system substrate-binding protein
VDDRLLNLIPGALASPLTRRQVLRRAAALGLAMPVMGTLAAACGGDDDDDDDGGTTNPTATTGGSGPTATQGTGTGATATTGGQQTTGGGKPGGSIAIGINREPDNLDSAVTPYAVSHTVMMNIYDPLIWRGNPDGEFYPGLASAWEAGADGMTYSFTLRDDVKFHDGTPFNGEAVKKFFDRVADPATKSGFAANLLGPYDTTEMTDDFNITVKMKAPFAPALDGMSQAFLGITSPTAVEADPTAFLKSPVGTGFMKFKEWVEADHITMVRNEEYNWGSPMFAHSGAAYLDEVTFRFYPDHPTRLAALEAGDVNMIEQLPDSELARFESDSNYEVQLGFSPGLPSVMMINLTKDPFTDIEVRKAFIQSIDRQALVDVANFGATEPAYGPLFKNTPLYTSDVETYYLFDLDAAKQTLEAAGWTEGSEGIREKGGESLSFTWVMGDAHAHYAELLQAQVREAGFDMQLQKASPTQYVEAAKTGESTVGTNGWISSDPVVLSNLFHSKNIDAWNWSRINDPALDTMLDDGEKEADPAKREQIYHDIQIYIMDQAPMAPLWGIHRNNALQSKYKDVKRDFRTYIWLYDAWVEE